jgi:hypothetical protein
LNNQQRKKPLLPKPASHRGWQPFMTKNTIAAFDVQKQHSSSDRKIVATLVAVCHFRDGLPLSQVGNEQISCDGHRLPSLYREPTIASPFCRVKQKKTGVTATLKCQCGLQR